MRDAWRVDAIGDVMHQPVADEQQGIEPREVDRGGRGGVRFSKRYAVARHRAILGGHQLEITGEAAWNSTS
jgi:hypothetical protein